MSDWSEGYVADIGYTYGYYGELNPLRAQWCLLDQGITPPANLLGPGSAACELGFGQGLSINMHAAATATEWWGTDFNPAQAAFAQELAASCGSNARIFDQAFADFCSRPDLPEFDSIGLHGIWTWVSDENRKIIVDFLRRKLKVGGVLYISYNTLPGWSAPMPLRHLLTEHASSAGTVEQGIVKRIDASVAFAAKFLELQPKYLVANPGMQQRFDTIKDQNRSYLAHEYFNRDWHPMYFADMGRWLGEAKLTYGGSAHFSDHVDGLNLTPGQRDLLAGIQDATFKETIRDYCVNQQFRRDYWVKGARRMTRLDQAEAFRKQRVMLVKPRAGVELKAVGVLGEGNLMEAVYAPVLDAMADNAPRTFAQIEQAVSTKGVSYIQLREVLTVMLGTGAVVQVQDEKLSQKARAKTDKLNQHLMVQARSTGDLRFLASPATGGAFSLTRFEILFLLARSNGRKQPADWAVAVQQVLAAQNERLLKEGKVLETPEENIAELTRLAEQFESQIGMLKHAGIA